MSSSKKWTKKEIIDFVRNTHFGYQKVNLPYGLSTPGKAREKTAEIVLKDVQGKSFLDVGSYLGYFCVKAAEKGASKIEGWEIDKERLKTARTIAEINQIKIMYREFDIETVETQASFDYVICLNLLHHLIDPIAALDKLIKITNDTMVLEIASVGTHDRKKLGLSFLTGLIVSRIPVIVVGKGATSIPYDRQQKYFFTKSAIDNILRYQRNYFADVKILNSEFKNRFLVIAKKRKIKHLVVVSGPTSSGKSTLIKEMISNKNTELKTKTGIQSFSDWDFVGANSLRKFKKISVDKLIFHYDFLRPFGRSAKTHARDEVLHILSQADKLTFITLDVSPERLKEQLVESEFYKRDAKSLKKIFGKLIRKIKEASFFDLIKNLFNFRSVYHIAIKGSSNRHRKILAIYENHESIKNQYRSWFDFIGGQKNKDVQSLIYNNQDNIFISLKEWEEKY